MKWAVFALVAALCTFSFAQTGDPLPKDPNVVDPVVEDPNASVPPTEDPNASEQPEVPDDGPVYFADPVLKNLVEDELWVYDPTPEDMLGLTSLRAPSRGITDLTGLEYAANLTVLELQFNAVRDVSPLAGATSLERLVINNNEVDGISSLSALTNLEHLDVHDNHITDISAVANMTKLKKMVIRLNPICDIGPLSGLTALEDLDAHMDQISDISPLVGLTNLQRLILQFNDISDVTPLAGLTKLTVLNLRYNEIDDISPLANLHNLETLDLSSNPLSDISPLVAIEGLDWLALNECTQLNTETYCDHLYTLADNGTILQYALHYGVPVNVVARDDFNEGGIAISWDAVCQGPSYNVYYQVYRAPDPTDPPEPISDWQTSLEFVDTTVEPGSNYLYMVRSGTSSEGDNASDLSDPAEKSVPGTPILTISSTAGGSVTVPGEGPFLADKRVMTVTARSIDPGLYRFAGWTGTAVDRGRVSDPTRQTTTVSVASSCTLRANFVTLMDVLYVDDDASSIAAFGGAAKDVSPEDGTGQHPFDSIQEAIEVAAKRTAIIVRPGLYHENINLLGKDVCLTGLDPNGTPLPIIKAKNAAPVVSFTSGEDPNCIVSGFVLSGGQGYEAGAILCRDSSPTVTHCLIAGNRAVDSQGGAIYCENSNAWFDHCTIADNVGGKEGAGIVLDDSNVTISNSIVYYNGPDEIAFIGDNIPAITYSDILGGWPDVGNIDMGPLFFRTGYWVDPKAPQVEVDPSLPSAVYVEGDYHLKSKAGRWNSQKQEWSLDSVTSPCIDAGDPAAAIGEELPPHGSITNMGVYGGTVQASLGQ